MRFVRIALPILLLAGIVAGSYIWPHVSTYFRMKSFTEDFEAVSRDYAALEAEFPFEAEEAKALEGDQVNRFIACRRALLEPFADWSVDMDKESLSFDVKLKRSTLRIPEIGQYHAKALREAGMSMTEYRWICDEVLRVLQYGGTAEAPEALIKLRSTFDKTPCRFRTHAGENGITWTHVKPGQEMRYLLDELPDSGALPTSESVEAVLRNARGIKETFTIFGGFDSGFSRFDYQGFLQKMNEQEKKQEQKMEEPMQKMKESEQRKIG